MNENIKGFRVVMEMLQALDGIIHESEVADQTCNYFNQMLVYDIDVTFPIIHNDDYDMKIFDNKHCTCDIHCMSVLYDAILHTIPTEYILKSETTYPYKDNPDRAYNVTTIDSRAFGLHIKLRCIKDKKKEENK